MKLWYIIGYNSLICLAALSAIDTVLYEASSIDGTSNLRQIRYVALPGIALISLTLILKGYW